LPTFSVEIEWDGTGWLKGNAGQTGFYRVNYEQQQWDQLTDQMDTNHKVGINAMANYSVEYCCFKV